MLLEYDAASEHSFLTDTAVVDAADMADEVSESVLKSAPSAAVCRMATKSFMNSEDSTGDSEHNPGSSGHKCSEVRTPGNSLKHTSCYRMCCADYETNIIILDEPISRAAIY